ncbi:MAG: hypothetical protein FD131_4413 [Rhodocyclaceae bacterium]|nr:MAG: hypothetical protein FD131_4413 [Rhodocyclaceae bacterium]
MKLNRTTLAQYARRLKEVLEEAGEFGRFFGLAKERANFQLCTSEEDLRVRIARWVNEVRVPGFCAHALAEEGFILLKLITARVIEARESKTIALSEYDVRFLEQLERLVNESEGALRQAKEEMAIYSSLDGREIAERILERFGRYKRN